MPGAKQILVFGIGTAAGLLLLNATFANRHSVDVARLETTAVKKREQSPVQDPGTSCRMEDPQDIVPGATAICLITIEKLTLIDQRPACGDLREQVEFRVEGCLGQPPSHFDVVKDHGGLRIARTGSGAETDIEVEVYAAFASDLLQQGQAYFVVFGEHQKFHDYPQGIPGCWPADSTEVPEQIRNAVSR